jgi:hypothetical protein
MKMKFPICIILLFSQIISLIYALKNQRKIKTSLKSKDGDPAFRKYENGSWKPIRLKFIHAIKYGYTSIWDEATFEAFRVKFFDKLTNFFSKFLKIYQVPSYDVSKVENDCSGRVVIPKANIITDVTGADIVFYVFPGGTTSGSMSAKACSFISYSSTKTATRPLAGVINFSENYVKNFKSFGDSEYNRIMGSTFHETTHALVFNGLFRRMVDDEGNNKTVEKLIVSKEIKPDEISFPDLKMTLKYIIDPKMQKVAQDYYNCPTAIGLPMNEKDEGHFYQLTNLQGNMKGSSDRNLNRLSEFVYSIYDISGWYIPNHDLVEKTFWGKGKGCNLANSKCRDENGNLFTEMCDAKDNGVTQCDPMYDSKGTCSNESFGFIHGCYHWQNGEDNQCFDPLDVVKRKEEWEFYGKENDGVGKCFEATKLGYKRQYCIKSICNQTDNSITATVAGKTFKTTFVNDKPSTESFEYDSRIFKWPVSFERFCFTLLNPQRYWNDY